MILLLGNLHFVLSNTTFRGFPSNENVGVIGLQGLKDAVAVGVV